MVSRVAITSSADQIDRLAGVFSQFGLVPVGLPCISVVVAGSGALADARRAAGPGAVLLLSSARPLDLLWPGGEAPPMPVIAVGTATAVAVRRRGGRVEFTGSAGLEALVDEGILDGRRIVFPRAAGTDPVLLGRIAQRATSLEAPVVYETVPQPPGDAEVDAVAFGSPSAVRGWVSARELYSLLVGAIGMTTAGELDAVGRRPDVIAPRPDFESLAEEMGRRLEVVL
jgi:uroporphyrinogen-III synthase